MSQFLTAIRRQRRASNKRPGEMSIEIDDCRRALRLDPSRIDTLPFVGEDVTAGSETELQVAVEGTRSAVDLARATDLQQLINALTYLYLAKGTLRHGDIPDRPMVESERRQIFFSSAIGLPYFEVGKDSKNLFLHRILARTQGVRTVQQERLRVPLAGYRLALVDLLEEEGAALVESMGLRETLDDLRRRLQHPEKYAVAARLDRAICERLNVRSAFEVPAVTYNLAAEAFYSGDLQRRHLEEAFGTLAKSLQSLDQRLQGGVSSLFPDWQSMLSRVQGTEAKPIDWQHVIHLLLLSEQGESGQADGFLSEAS